jgi:exopolysaccharide production protein ExoQ
LVAVIAMFAFLVTKGPVFYVRLNRGPLSGDFIDDRWVQRVFIVASATVAAYCIRGARQLCRDPWIVLLVAVLLAVLAMSTAWSVAPGRTRDQVLMMAVGSAAALLAGATVSVRELILAWWLAAQAGIGISIVALERDWAFARGDGGYPAGIYLNRNSFAAVAALSVLTSFGVIAWSMASRGGVRAAGVVLGGSAMLVGLEVLRRTGSFTPTVGLLVTVVVAGCVVKSRAARRILDRTVASIALVGAALLLIGLALYASRGRSGSSGLLSGRDVVWHVVLDWIRRRPLQGYGFMAVWTKQDIANDQFALGVLVFEAHSGYLEVFVGAGILALIPLLALGGMSLVRAVTGLRGSVRLETAWPAVAILYCLTVNLAETYVGANLHPWILLLMAVVLAGRTKRAGAAVDPWDVGAGTVGAAPG